jgi:hypothetical protein
MGGFVGKQLKIIRPVMPEAPINMMDHFLRIEIPIE